MPVIVVVALASFGALFMVVFLTEISKPPARANSREVYGRGAADRHVRPLSVVREAAGRRNVVSISGSSRRNVVTMSTGVVHRATNASGAIRK